MTKYRFRPIVGSTNLETARTAPPAMSNTVVILAFCLNPNPKDKKNSTIEDMPTSIPLC